VEDTFVKVSGIGIFSMMWFYFNYIGFMWRRMDFAIMFIFISRLGSVGKVWFHDQEMSEVSLWNCILMIGLILTPRLNDSSSLKERREIESHSFDWKSWEEMNRFNPSRNYCRTNWGSLKSDLLEKKGGSRTF
jgi:hypothetical protein